MRSITCGPLVLMGILTLPAVALSQTADSTSSITITLEEGGGTAVVSEATGGVVHVCIEAEALCFGISPYDVQYEHGDVAIEGPVGIVVRSWNLTQIAPYLRTKDGEACPPDDPDCDIGIGYLIVAQRQGGQLLSGMMRRGDDHTPELIRVVEGPRSYSLPSLLWIETRAACGGVCQRFQWEALMVEWAGASVTRVAGPFQTGVQDGDPEGDQICISTTRAGPIYDLSDQSFVVPDGVELGDEAAEFVRLAWNGGEATFREVTRQSQPLSPPQRHCEPLSP